jgi:hypothetical protein
MVQGSGSRFRVQGSGFRVQGSEFKLQPAAFGRSKLKLEL